MILGASSYVSAMAALAVVALVAMAAVGTGFLASRREARSATTSLRRALKAAGGAGSEEVLAAIAMTPMRVLAADKELRRHAYEAFRLQAGPVVTSVPQGESPRDDERGYETIRETMVQLPPAIPENAENPPQKAGLVGLAEALSSMGEPFRTWSKRFGNAAETLGRVLPMDTRLDALLRTALQAKAHFDVDFYGAATAVRERAEDRDATGCEQAIDAMVSSVTSFVRLTGDWYELRRDAAGLMHVGGDGSESHWDGDLKHLAVHLAEPGTGRPMVWWQSSLLSRSDSIDRLSAWIFREIDDRKHDGLWSTAPFSAVCSMSSTGTPLATMISAHYGIRFLVVDETAGFRFPPGFRPDPGKTVLLVDSNISTGRHVVECRREIARSGADVAGAVVICENDLCPPGERLEYVETLRNDGRLIRLFTLSDIYEHWRERQV